jgi:hypothetical protein
MIRVDSNISHVIKVISDELEHIDVQKMTREQASTLMADMKTRIHKQGKASDGSAIGSYSRGYLAVRSGQFKNSGKSDAGFHSKGKNAIYDIKSRKAVKVKKSKGSSGDSMRVKYNRGNDPKVILSLTRKMEGQMVLIPIENGTAIGYSNEADYMKSQWAEKTYKKEIFSATVEEVANVLEIGQKYINDSLK